jgi:hypothetical protein
VDVSEGMPPLKLPYNISGELTDAEMVAGRDCRQRWPGPS